MQQRLRRTIVVAQRSLGMVGTALHQAAQCVQLEKKGNRYKMNETRMKTFCRMPESAFFTTCCPKSADQRTEIESFRYFVPRAEQKLGPRVQHFHITLNCWMTAKRQTTRRLERERERKMLSHMNNNLPRTG